MAKSKITPEQFRRNLQTYEGMVGQKKAADKLGVSVSTFRAWKNGANVPKSQAQKFNRVYGQNKKKLSDPSVQAKVERSIRTRENKSKVQLDRTKIKQQATNKWVYETFNATFIIVKILQEAPEFVAYIRGDQSKVQFFTPTKMQMGKPAGINSVKVYGLYLNKYVYEQLMEDGLNPEDAEDGQTDMFVSLFPVQDGKPDTWDLDTMLEYMERKFMAGSKTVGRRRYEPCRFIGYELR